MQTNIDITQAFLDAPDGILTIHQLASKLKLPYGTAYNRVHLLNKQNILQILPQGKAKLCALNSENPMTANLLALGGAQITSNYLASLEDNGRIFNEIVNKIKTKAKDKVLTSILLSPSALFEACKKPQEPTETEKELENNLPEMEEFQKTIDFFFIKSSEKFDESIIENEIASILPKDQNISITSMVVDTEALLGMLSIEEADAGLAAYSMLHDGVILTGFEYFYSIILESFTKKLSSLQ